MNKKTKIIIDRIKDLQDEFGFHFSSNSCLFVHDFGFVDDLQQQLDDHTPEPPETEAPEPAGFEGTREQLNNLGIRK